MSRLRPFEIALTERAVVICPYKNCGHRMTPVGFVDMQLKKRLYFYDCEICNCGTGIFIQQLKNLKKSYRIKNVGAR